ncbi:CoA transferase [Phenylobacterium sp.]|uniref:CaiB/BaiF CoA-transferase family protein n=1 Tax=Phenylobacterium sp. TaxID=1871053 RepID=UPI003BAA3307
MSGLLAGYRVLDLGGALGAACGRFLATLGADVVKVEPPGGDPARLDAHGRLDPAWIARNLGKRSVVLELDSPDLKALAAKADILIDALPAARRAVLGLDHATASRTNPGLIGVSITPFGSAGPYADWAGGELVCSALGGTMAVTGYPDRAPVKEAADACVFHANGSAAAGALFAVVERATSGLGQHVDVSIQEVAASRNTNGVLAWQFDRKLLPRTGVQIAYGMAKIRCIWQLADGYAFHSLASGRAGAAPNAALCAWMTEAGFDCPMAEVDWPTYNRSTVPAETRAQWESAMDAFFQTRTKAEVAARREINATVANEPGDVLADPHLLARGLFAQAGDLVAPKAFIRAGELSIGTAPEIGQHTAEVLAEWPAASTAAHVAKPSHEPPLKGLKVLDFSWALVGSVTTKNLADYGATVIKVESSTRPCLSRIDVQVAASKAGQFDDKPWFIHMNTSKRGLRINMKHPRWREVIDPLIAWADVVVENFSPGTMASLGLDYETLRARRPDLIMLSGSIYGQTGPLARTPGVDGTGAALSGRLFMTGWSDRPPVTPSAVPYGDLLLPPYMAAALAAAVDHRRRTGEGCHIDASMYEICVQQMAGAMLEAQIDGPPQRTGNADRAVLLQGVYPTAGQDRWIAISAEDEAAVARLAGLMAGTPSDDTIAAWTATQDGYALMARLQGAGVAAGVVQTCADLVDRDPQLRERAFLTCLDNPVLGAFEHQALPYKLSRTPAVMTTAPGLGQHNESICRDLIGLSAETYAELAAAQLFE